MLAKKVLLIFAAADRLNSPVVLSGLLGGGAYRNNRPLVLLLHLLLQPVAHERRVEFHLPVFWDFCGLGAAELEQRIMDFADLMLADLRRRRVDTLAGALALLLDARLALSTNDGDLAQEPLLGRDDRD